MNICNICHEPLRKDQLIKSYHGYYSWYGQMNRAHLDCYKRAVKLAWTFAIETWVLFIAGVILISFGAIAVAGDDDFMAKSTGTVLLVIGIVSFVISVICGALWIKKYFDIRKHPGQHLVDPEYDENEKD